MKMVAVLAERKRVLMKRIPERMKSPSVLKFRNAFFEKGSFHPLGAHPSSTRARHRAAGHPKMHRACLAPNSGGNLPAATSRCAGPGHKKTHHHTRKRTPKDRARARILEPPGGTILRAGFRRKNKHQKGEGPTVGPHRFDA